MTARLAPVTSLVASPHLPADLQAWTAWLQAAVDPSWRVDEWDGANWLFTGDLTNPRTAVWKCTTGACDAVMKARGQRCQSCDLAFRAGDLSPTEFDATHVPVRMAAFPGTAAGRCIVSRGETPCSFAVFTRGLCESHYGLWRLYERQQPGASMHQWARMVARPRTTTFDGCLVGRCGEALQSGLGLCCYHHRKWKQDRSAARAPADWARGQSPFLRANQFALLRLNPTLRWEFLYALQQRDMHGGKIDPPSVRATVRAFAHLSTLIGVDQATALAMLTTKGINNESHAKELVRRIRFGHDEYSGIKQTDKEVWRFMQNPDCSQSGVSRG